MLSEIAACSEQVSMSLGNVECDRPSPIEPQHLKNGLRQTSSQILMLSVLLPFIVINHCNPAILKNFNLLVMIMRLCLSHILTMGHVPLLKRMIRKYLMTFIILFPGCFTPKHHFLIHLPTQIILFSILTEQWAMRFEAFHAIMKRLCKILHNAKNLPFSLIMRVLSLQAYKMHLNKTNFLTNSAIKPKVHERMMLTQVCHKEKVAACVGHEDIDCQVDVLARLKWYGQEFSEGDTILVTPPSANLLPKFATLVKLLSIQNKFIVVYRELKTICYSEDLNAYRVECEQDACFEALDITGRCDLSQLIIIKHDDASYVVLRRDSNPHFTD